MMSSVIKMRSINSRRIKKKGNSSSSSDLKVVYISSPMKVKTCASNFRTTVQQLTGRDSDLIDRLMDEYANKNDSTNNNILDLTNGDSRRVSSSNNSYESSTSSGSMALEESGGADAGLMFSDVGGGGGGEGFEGGFSFEEIFGAAGFLLECGVDEGGQFC